MVGIKQIAWSMLGDSCPYYTKDDERKWKMRNKRHERVKNEVVRLLEMLVKAKLSCIEECGLSKQTKYGVIRGKIDLLCWEDHEVFVVEVKSSDISRASSHDSLQLRLYVSLLMDKNASFECDDNKDIIREIRMKNKRLRGFLAYSNHRLRDVVLVELDQSYLSEAKRITDKINLIFSQSESKAYVIGNWCYTCSNKQCPVYSALHVSGVT